MRELEAFGDDLFLAWHRRRLAVDSEGRAQGMQPSTHVLGPTRRADLVGRSRQTAQQVGLRALFVGAVDHSGACTLGAHEVGGEHRLELPMSGREAHARLSRERAHRATHAISPE